jgi:hypothetical protein
METAKIRVKIGPHEFEAEGPASQVAEQFEAWKALIASVSAPAKALELTGTAGGTLTATGTISTIGQADLAHLYNLDEKRDLVTLRILPTGEDRHREAVLLTLYGYLRLKQMDEVVVTKLKASLEAAGSAPDRVDRAAIPSQREGYIVKGGSGKGGKYRLTNKGIGKTEEMIHKLLQQLI